MNSPFITSLLYYQGAILASRKTSYADILKADCLEEVVRELMMEQHKQMIRDLMHGRLNRNNPPRESTYTPSKTEKAATAPAPAQPKQEKPVEPSSQPEPAPPKEKSLDDIILDFLEQEQKERNRKK